MNLRPAPRVAWLGAAAILIVAALVALGAVVKGDFSDTDGRILGSLAAVLYAGGALFAGLATVDLKNVDRQARGGDSPGGDAAQQCLHRLMMHEGARVDWRPLLRRARLVNRP